MKNKSLIKTALLSSALLLGTGYAVINNRVLTATGTVPIATKNLDVVFTADSKTASGNVGVITNDGHTLTLTFSTVDEETYAPAFDIYIKNNETDLTVQPNMDYKVYDQDGNELSKGDFSIYTDYTIDIDTEEEMFGSDRLPIKPSHTIHAAYSFYLPEYIDICQYEYFTIEITYTISPVI